MKLKLLIIALVLFISACGTSNESGEATEGESSEPATERRYSYSDTFEMADQANLAIVRNWNNALEAGDVDLAFTYVADSIHIVRPDGTEYNLTRDSLKSVVSQMLSEFSNIRVDFVAAAAVYNSEYDHTWVISYTDESFTSSEGDMRVVAHELYRIENGLIREQHAYAKVPAEDNPAPTEDHGDEYLYSGSFVLGNSENIDVVEGFLDAVVNKNFDALGGYLADSTTAYFADGMVRDVVRDTVVSDIRNYVMETNLRIEHSAIMSLRNTNDNEEFVLVWFDEITSTPDGEKTVELHEAYLMQDGKIRTMRQWSKVPVPEN